MSYYGKRIVSTETIDPTKLVQINTATSLTATSVDREYLINSPANFTVTLPQVSTVKLRDRITFVHNHSSGAATIALFAGDTLKWSGSSVTSFTLNPGDILTVEVTNTTEWNVIDTNKVWTAPQGRNDNTPASTAFVIGEVNKHRNYIINGNFGIWQRGTSNGSPTTGSKYLADRFFNDSNGSTYTQSRQSLTAAETEAMGGYSQFFQTTNVTSVAGSGNYANLVQRIENVRKLAGKTVTLSFWAKADANKNIAVDFSQNFGTGGSPSAQVNVGTATFALTTSWQKFTTSVTLPSIVGKTIGSTENNFTQIVWWLDAGSTYSARTGGLGQQSIIFHITQVQLEDGSVATEFDNRPEALETLLCQRYFERGFHSAVQISSAFRGNNNFRVMKRASVIFTIFNSTTGVAGSIRGEDGTNYSPANISGSNVDFSVSNDNIGGSAGMIYSFTWTADAEL